MKQKKKKKKAIRQMRPFSLVDFVSLIQAMWRYLGDSNRVQAWKCPTLKENIPLGQYRHMICTGKTKSTSEKSIACV